MVENLADFFREMRPIKDMSCLPIFFSFFSIILMGDGVNINILGYLLPSINKKKGLFREKKG